MKRKKSQAPVALITGAARRIGAAIAQRLHAAGYHVVLHYLQSENEALSLSQKLNQLENESALAVKADLLKENDLNELLRKTLNWAHRLDVLVNNASVFLSTDSMGNGDWEVMFNTNVKAPYDLSKAAYPSLTEQSGSIINITDVHAHKPLKGYGVYCQTKAALTMQTMSLAREFAPKVRVNAVAPGAIAWPEHGNELDEAVKLDIINKTPLRKHGSPEHIAQAVLNLIENTFVTGQILRVDGGRSLV